MATFDDKAKVEVLKCLAVKGVVTDAALAGGVSPETVNRHKREKHADGSLNESYDRDFAMAFDVAMEGFRDSLRQEAWRRGHEGWNERPVLDKEGNIVGHVKKYSDRMLELLLMRHDPEFRPRPTLKVEADLTGNVTHSHAQLEADLSKLDRKGREAMRVVMKQLAAHAEEEATPAQLPEGERSH